MIKIYSMPTCKDCAYVETQLEGRNDVEVINIGSHVKLLKEFLVLRDTLPVFEDVRKNGRAGIPCFVLEDGTVTLTPEDAGFESLNLNDGPCAGGHC